MVPLSCYKCVCNIIKHVCVFSDWMTCWLEPHFTWIASLRVNLERWAGCICTCRRTRFCFPLLSCSLENTCSDVTEAPSPLSEILTRMATWVSLRVDGLALHVPIVKYFQGLWIMLSFCFTKRPFPACHVLWSVPLSVISCDELSVTYYDACGSGDDWISHYFLSVTNLADFPSQRGNTFHSQISLNPSVIKMRSISLDL